MAKVVKNFRGKFHWAKVFKDNYDKGYGDKPVPRYVVTFEPDDPEAVLSVMRGEGVYITGVNEETIRMTTSMKDGKVKLSRRVSDVKTFKDKKTGEDIQHDFGGLPIVKKLDGDSVVDWDVDDESMGLIGNGSSGVVGVQFLKTPSGDGYMRLDSMLVENHVKFDGVAESANNFDNAV